MLVKRQCPALLTSGRADPGHELLLEGQGDVSDGEGA